MFISSNHLVIDKDLNHAKQKRTKYVWKKIKMSLLNHNFQKEFQKNSNFTAVTVEH